MRCHFPKYFFMDLVVVNNIFSLVFLIFPVGIGQPLSMLLKLNPAVTKLNLFDIVHTPGVAADLSHCETKSDSTGFVGQEQLKGLDTEQFFLSFFFCNHQEPMMIWTRKCKQ